ncbi:hypothetical protein [Sagittula marina]|uniref:hypothetical protein n=1 Tax=Sagittula marina TaxID=943940 RepID=UPI00161487FE|nr:hypothetical protein [Sagittula marina]
MPQNGSNNVPSGAKRIRSIRPSNATDKVLDNDTRSDLDCRETISAIIGAFIDIAFGRSATDLAQEAAKENIELSQTISSFHRNRTKTKEEKN